MQAATIAAGANISDNDITMNVRAALGQDPVLKGDVQLTGTMNEQSQIDDAIKLARADQGAHSVHDELVLKK